MGYNDRWSRKSDLFSYKEKHFSYPTIRPVWLKHALKCTFWRILIVPTQMPWKSQRSPNLVCVFIISKSILNVGHLKIPGVNIGWVKKTHQFFSFESWKPPCGALNVTNCMSLRPGRCNFSNNRYIGSVRFACATFPNSCILLISPGPKKFFWEPNDFFVSWKNK